LNTPRILYRILLEIKYIVFTKRYKKKYIIYSIPQ